MYGKDLRLLIPAACSRTYLNTGTLGPTPTTALAAAAASEMEWEESGPGHPQNYVNARDMGRQFAKRIEQRWPGGTVSLTENNSMALMRVLWGIPFAPDDEIITTTHEHDAVVLALVGLAKRFDLRIRVVDADRPQGLIAGVMEVLGPKTRLVVISHVSYLTGWEFPINDVRHLLDKYPRCELLVDGAQALGNIVVDPERLGAHYYVFCGHKWMLAPAGWAGLWVRNECLAHLASAWPSLSSVPPGISWWQMDQWPKAQGGESLEYGTRSWPRVAGWSVTWDYFEEEGFVHHASYQQGLAQAARDRLKRMPGIELIEPYDRSYRQTSLMTVRGPSHEKLVQTLWEQEVVVKAVPSYQGIRIAWAIFNTLEDVQRLESVLVGLAR